MNEQTTSQIARRIRITIAGSLVLVFGGALSGALFQINAQSPKRPVTSSANRGPREGITVHGHWKLEVRNPDGTLAHKVEFENDLTDSGEVALRDFLSRNRTPGLWQITLHQSGSSLNIYESTFPGTTSASKDLKVGTLYGSVLLSGTATAEVSLPITAVSTFLTSCPNTVAPAALNSACLASFGQLFTHVGFMTPDAGGCPPNTQCIVPVVTGQTIQVTVAISFSSANSPAQ